MYLALDSGLPSFRPDCSCPALLRNLTLWLCTCLAPGSHGLWRRVPNVLRYMPTLQWTTAVVPVTSSNPQTATPAGLTRSRFGLTPVRSPLLRGYSLFLGVREMFQFPRCPPTIVGNRRSGWVAPFGNRGIIGHTRLPHAYRSGVTSFIGMQRRGIHHVLILSSLQEPLPTATVACRAAPPRSMFSTDSIGKVQTGRLSHDNPLRQGLHP